MASTKLYYLVINGQNHDLWNYVMFLSTFFEVTSRIVYNFIRVIISLNLSM